MDTSPSHIDCETLLKHVDAELRATRAELNNERRHTTLMAEQYKSLNDYTSTLLSTVASQQDTIIQQRSELNHSKQVNRLQQQHITALTSQYTVMQSLVKQQQKELNQRQQQNILLQKEVDKLSLVQHQRKVLSKQVFGRKSEKSHEDQDDHQSFTYPETTAGEDKNTFAKNWFSSKEPLPDSHEHWDKNIPRQIINLIPKNLPRGARKIDERVFEILCHQKEKIYIKRYVRHVYLVEDENEAGKFKNYVVPLPAHPIPGCKADVGIIAQILLDKFFFHAPLKRQQARFMQNGAGVPYSTINDWANKGTECLLDLYHCQVAEMINGGMTQCDESPVWVIDHSIKKKGKKSRRAQMFVLCNPVQNIALYHYGKGRGHEDIKALLDGYTGYLHTDGLGTYTMFGKQKGVKHGKCLGHPRRKFVESKDSDADRARFVLKEFINPLYGIERACKQQQLSYDQITVMRQTYAVPILTEMFAWLKREREKVLKRTPIYIAINYLINMEQEIMLYTTDGMYPIDNLMAERLVKLLALGRKNYMFLGSDRGAKNAAIMYTFMATCQLQNINPAQWLTDVLHRIATHPKDKLRELLPQFWKPLSSEALSA